MVRGGEGIYLDDPIASVYDPNDQHHLTPTTKANARLIAAAPELLAALEACTQAIDILFARIAAAAPPDAAPDTFYPSRSGKPWEAMIQAQAALAKARGAA